jgi:2-amino-4-hydroxy-6-hydroxymethyldihydropteridine diphosphokinase
MNPLHCAYLLMGSNLGNRLIQLQQAREALSTYGAVLQASSIYETAAWGKESLPPHYNQALRLQTVLSPLELLQAIHLIEQQLGRVRQEQWGVRSIDIDIIYFDNIILETPQLTIPHIWMQQRRFVLEPLCEIAPQYLHPVFKETNTTLLNRCTDSLSVSKVLV